MRARSLKPSIFKNELLAVADPLYTLIFEGLWCVADREGRLEDRPAKIHMEINPGRTFDGTDTAIRWLAENGFILRYGIGGSKYIQIVNFTKHQKPHVNEKDSVIPAFGSDQGTKQAPPTDEHTPQESTAKAESEHYQGTKHLALTPDSGLLTPESSLREGSKVLSAGRDRKGSTTPKGSCRVPADFSPDLAYARAQIPDIDAEREAQKFRDWEFKTPRKDWAACWRTWIGNCRDRGQYARLSGGGKGGERGLERLNFG